MDGHGGISGRKVRVTGLDRIDRNVDAWVDLIARMTESSAP